MRRRARGAAGPDARARARLGAALRRRALGEDRFDRLTDALADEPCPLLDEAGRCRIYADRPLVCRLIGLGMRTPTGRLIENACPIQDRFPGYAALAPAPFDLEAFEEGEVECLRAAAVRRFGTRSGGVRDHDRRGDRTSVTADGPSATQPERSEALPSSTARSSSLRSGCGLGMTRLRPLRRYLFSLAHRRTAPRSPGTCTGSPAPT